MTAGLTGGIGSGKSTVAKLFEIFGCAVFYSDDVAKNIYFEEPVKQQVKKLLGNSAYLSERLIDKTYISSKIFNNTDLLHQLNSIIHPAVGKKFEDFKKQHNNKIIIKETALLFEAKLEKQVEKIIVVASSDELRIKRVMQRDKLTKEDVLKKFKSQMPQEEKIKKADFVIYNNEEEFLITQVLEVFDKIRFEATNLSS